MTTTTTTTTLDTRVRRKMLSTSFLQSKVLLLQLFLIKLLCNNKSNVVHAFSIIPTATTFFHHQRHHRFCHYRNQQILQKLTIPSSSSLSSLVTNEETSDGAPTDQKNPNEKKKQQPSLPNLFPLLSQPLTNLGYIQPTPIQSSSAHRALIKQENLLLIAPTGSGKTLAYLCPSLSRAIQSQGTILIVAPTRELAVQLMRDAADLLLLGGDEEEGDENDDDAICLAVKGVEPPTPYQLSRATMLIGTPSELLTVITSTSGGYEFVAGDILSTVILDEVDVLLPFSPKTLRTSLDSSSYSYSTEGRRRRRGGEAQEDRRKQEQKRKILAAKRKGVDIELETQRIISPTERILGIVAMCRMQQRRRLQQQQEYLHAPPQILAGSATASRKTLDRLNQALRFAAEHDASSTFDLVWSSHVKPCRPDAQEEKIFLRQMQTQKQHQQQKDVSDAKSNEQQQQQHTIRSVTVPSQVQHRYISMTKEASSSPNEILKTLTLATKTLLNEKAATTATKTVSLSNENNDEPTTTTTILLFLCGEFGKPNKQIAPTTNTKFIPKGATSKARRNSLMKHRQRVAKNLFESQRNSSSSKKKKQEKEHSGLSARKACKILKNHGINTAQPLHVALGLESNIKKLEQQQDDEDVIIKPNNQENDDDNNDVLKNTNVYVTFEGSARGLHFDGVDIVFVVGRPSSAAAYLHLAGRVGRSSVASVAEEEKKEKEGAGGSGGVVIRPGTVVSFCGTKGSCKELEKWVKQIGGTDLEELVLLN